MKIGFKIALFYVTITISIIIIIILIFYFFSSYYINKLYDSYLKEKTYLTAQMHWEKDEVDEQSYQIISQRYNEVLPQAREILLNMDSSIMVKDTLSKYLTKNQQNILFKNDSIPITFTYKKQLGAALYYPDNEGHFIVLIMSKNSYGKEIQEHLILLSLFLIITSSIFIFFIGKIYSNRILSPLQYLLKELKRIRGNNLNLRIKKFGNKDELDELVLTLNNMLDRIDTAFKSEKSFINNASHELNNPVTAIQGECEISLLKERNTQEYIEALHRISEESKRISQLIKHLLFLSRQDDDLLLNNIDEINLQLFLYELCKNTNQIKLICKNNQNNLTTRANRYLLQIAIQNIIDNACKYSNGKEVIITLSKQDDNIIITIKDQGIGIPENEIQNIFQSFYRASNSREFKGNGIGLSLSMKIISLYGGKLNIQSILNSFTEVSIYLKNSQKVE